MISAVKAIRDCNAIKHNVKKINHKNQITNKLQSRNL